MNIRETILQEMVNLLKEDKAFEVVRNGISIEQLNGINVTGNGSPNNPFVFVNDNNFSLKEKLTKIYSIVNQKNIENYRLGRRSYFIKTSVDQRFALYGLVLPPLFMNEDAILRDKPLGLEEAQSYWNAETKTIEKEIAKERKKDEERKKEYEYADSIIPYDNISRRKKDTYNAYKFITLGADWCGFCKALKANINTRLKKIFNINYEYISVKDKSADFFPKMYPNFMAKVQQAIKLNNGLDIYGGQKFDVNTFIPASLPITFILEGNNVIGFVGGNFIDETESDIPSKDLRAVIVKAKKRNISAPFAEIGTTPVQPVQPTAPTAPAAKPAAPATAQPAFKAGDRVSYPNAGIFTVAAVNGNKVTIKNSKGQQVEVDAKWLTKR